MHLIRLIKSAAPEANFLAGISVIGLLIKVLFLNKHPAWNINFFELGVLLEAILASIVAGYVFYIFVNHLQEFQKHQIVAPFVLKQSQRIVGECKGQLVEFSKVVSRPLELSTLSIEDINFVFSNIHPHDQAPLIMANTRRNATWFEFFDYHIIRTRDKIRKLLDQLTYVPPKMLVLILEIEDSSHFSIIRMVLNKPINNIDLSVFADPFFKYCELCKALDLLNNKHEKSILL